MGGGQLKSKRRHDDESATLTRKDDEIDTSARAQEDRDWQIGPEKRKGGKIE